MLSSRLGETVGRELKHQYLQYEINIFWSRWLLRPVGHQTCQLRAWKPGFLSQESSAKHPQPGILSQESSARFLSQDSSARSLQPGVLSQDSSARSPQPGFLSQESSAKIPQPGFLSQESPANLFGVRAGVIFVKSRSLV